MDMKKAHDTNTPHSPKSISIEKEGSLYDFLREGEFEAPIDMPVMFKSVGKKFEYEVATLLRKHLKNENNAGKKEVVELEKLAASLDKIQKKYPKNKSSIDKLVAQIQLHGGQ